MMITLVLHLLLIALLKTYTCQPLPTPFFKLGLLEISQVLKNLSSVYILFIFK
ncbi:hypothetical protein NSTC745_00636 [Nostoc sp. DSM 114161]|jgi:hypothetical protein